MMSIGELAAAAGTTPRTVRHYHSVGLLPEALRRPNGYREYDARALLMLIRVRRLTGLGLSLPEVGVALAGDGDRDLREILTEVAADLARQEQALRTRREQLLDVLAREHDLDLSPVVANLLAGFRDAVPEELTTIVAHESTLLQLLEATTPPERFDAVSTWYADATGEPECVERSLALARRFARLADVAPEHPLVAEVAAEFTAEARRAQAQLDPGAPAADPEVWAGYLATLAPAQARCLETIRL